MKEIGEGWRPLLEEALRLHAHQPPSRYAQLASVRQDGRPANRTVNFRFFLDPGDRLVFTTDLRSAKITQLKAQPWAELCWYFEETREQFRLSGRVEIVGESQDPELDFARLRTWRERSEASRQSVTWPRPGDPRSGGDEFQRPAPVDPPPHFALLILVPEEVDHLELRPHPHRRTRFVREGDAWKAVEVNP